MERCLGAYFVHLLRLALLMSSSPVDLFPGLIWALMVTIVFPVLDVGR